MSWSRLPSPQSRSAERGVGMICMRGRVLISVEQAVRPLERHVRTWQVVDVTDFIVLEAARGVRDHAMSFWDAQVWATAELNQIPVVLSEDFASGSVIEGVQFENPFAGE